MLVDQPHDAYRDSLLEVRDVLTRLEVVGRGPQGVDALLRGVIDWGGRALIRVRIESATELRSMVILSLAPISARH